MPLARSFWTGWPGDAGTGELIAGPPQVMVAADGICRTFGSGHTAVHALRGVSFTVDRGQLVALRGRSGSGKTTLLNIIGGLDDPTAGRVWVDGREVNRMTERERLELRRDRVAFVFQAFGLVPMLSAAENVGIPLRIEGVRPRWSARAAGSNRCHREPRPHGDAVDAS